jgi:hypothetical protein
MKYEDVQGKVWHLTKDIEEKTSFFGGKYYILYLEDGLGNSRVVNTASKILIKTMKEQWIKPNIEFRIERRRGKRGYYFMAVRI